MTTGCHKSHHFAHFGWGRDCLEDACARECTEPFQSHMITRDEPPPTTLDAAQGSRAEAPGEAVKPTGEIEAGEANPLRLDLDLYSDYTTLWFPAVPL